MSPTDSSKNDYKRPLIPATYFVDHRSLRAYHHLQEFLYVKKQFVQTEHIFSKDDFDRGDLTGPYVIQGNSVYNTVNLPNLEDPVLWHSGGLYHIVVNSWSERKAYHLTSQDGIKNWTNQGLAFDPKSNFLRYTDGTVNHWNKIERPGVMIENSHVTHFTFAVIDVEKENDLGNDGHGSKVIVVPFDGVALDPPTAAIPETAAQNGKKSMMDAVRISHLHNNSISIAVPYRSAFEICIMQANGKTIKTIRADNATTCTFSRYDFNAGVYFVNIVANKDKLVKTIVMY